MVENVRSQLMLIGAVLIASLILLLLPDRPIPLGLDLAGGTRMVLRLDFQQAYRDKALDPSEPKDKVLEETIAILRKRVDPTGVREPQIRRVGDDRIELSIPGAADIPGEPARAALAEPIPEQGTPPIRLGVPPSQMPADPARMQAALEKVISAFPGNGGVIQIDSEKIRYKSRAGDQLVDLERGSANTQVAAHDAGATVVLVSDDAIRRAISDLGDMRFYIAAKPADFTALGTDEAAEREKVIAWLKKPEHDGLRVSIHNSLPRELGGPPPGIRWFTYALEEGEAFRPRAERNLMALKTPAPEWTFLGEDLASVDKRQDEYGFPAVGFEIRDAKKSAFGDFTRGHLKEVMAIVLNDEVVSSATINSELPGSGIIYGRFTDRKVDELVTVLRSGSLKIKPIIEAEERVGATVGQEYVDQGWVMGLAAAAFVIIFLCLYFRWLGVYASIGLAANMLIQLGAMVALQATLTLPGIAGIILAIGMAVDADVLVFERIREEQDNGKRPLQAAKAGFTNALSAIIDGNVTTVLAGLILYNLGTGPIRGFAVTLIIGVLSSLFSVLVIVRVLIHLHLERRPDERFKMGRWFANANYAVISKAKLFISVSIILIVVGLAWFANLEPREKYGIDFLGGATVKVRVDDPQTIDSVRGLVATIPGDIGSSAEVQALPNSEVGQDRYTEFRISFKTSPEAGKSSESEQTFRSEIQHGLADILQKGPIEVALAESGDASTSRGSVYLEFDHSPADVGARLVEAGIKDPQVTARAERTNVFDFTGTAAVGVAELDLEVAIRTAFTGQKDSAGKSYRLAEPIPETAVVGAQMVSELRDSAIKALLLSMFVTVIYIRVRFAEYSYGLAAVAALLHDLLLTVGVVAFMVSFPFIHVEFNMALVAVFLTIVGYSINDTIVVFDRIRENLPRRQAKDSLEKIVNDSINETFSRTIITSTSMCTIVIVLLFNLGTGNVLESFSFAMAFGIATGTLSSIAVASPVFVWLEKRQMRKDQESKAPPPPKPQPALR